MPPFHIQIKIGDFGLATRVETDGERKRTLCGTPNYIAPEVLGKKGHSFEVDVWSIGCILYTLLVGKPPFETQTLKDTYARIKRNEYHVPSRIGPAAKNLISKLLQVWTLLNSLTAASSSTSSLTLCPLWFWSDHTPWRDRDIK